jgi:tetratricopeptide (TPR) repeat protein
VLLGYETLRTCRFIEAQKHVAQALKHARGPYFKYRAYRAAGHLSRHLHRYEEAEAHYFEAACYLRGTEYRSTIDLYLGLTNLGLERYEKAEDYFRSTLEAHRNYGNQRIIARAKFGLASTYIAQAEKFAQLASDLANEAREVCLQMKLQRELEQTDLLIKRLNTQYIKTP